MKYLFVTFTLSLLLLTACNIDFEEINTAGDDGIDLSAAGFDRKIVQVNAGWVMCWNEMQSDTAGLPPEKLFNRPNCQPANVPGIWNDLKLDGQHLPGTGYATYYLKLRLPASRQKLAFLFHDSATSMRVSFNGQFLGSIGWPARSAEDYVPHFSSQIMTLPDYDHTGVQVVAVEVANFVHFKGGLWEPVSISTRANLFSQKENTSRLEFFLIGAILLMGIYHIGLASLGGGRKGSLLFGAFCVLIAMRIMITGERSLFELFPGAGWSLVNRLEYLTAYGSTIVFYHFMSVMFPGYYRSLFFKIPVTVLYVFSLGVLFLPDSFYTRSLIIFLGIVVLLFSGAVVQLFKARQKGEYGAVPILIGLFILVLSSVNDIVDAVFALGLVDLAPAGLFGFIFFQAYLLSARFAASLQKVEQMTLDLQQKNTQIEFQASHDELTGFYNRRFLKDKLGELLSAPGESRRFALFFLDLDRFKTINDSFGHDTGDRLLVAISERLKSGISSEDMLFRPGGDEFICLLPSIENTAEVRNKAAAILRSFAKPFHLGGHEFFMTVSIGISIYPEHGDTMGDLLRAADMAMYQAKENGKNRYEFIRLEESQMPLRRLQLERYIKKAIEHEMFYLNYQPKVDLKTGQIVGLEALVRLDDENGRQMSAGTIIPIAEETGLIIPLGRFILAEACNFIKRNRIKIPIAVNVSPREFLELNFFSDYCRTIERTGVRPSLLQLEVTESVLVRNPDYTQKILDSIRTLGTHIAIDDFGSGYSSLGYLKDLSFDVLKLDRTFMFGVPGNRANEAIIRAVLNLSQDLGFKVIAEGAEHIEQVTYLKKSGCHEIQGYFFYPPLPEAELNIQNGQIMLDVQKV